MLEHSFMDTIENFINYISAIEEPTNLCTNLYRGQSELAQIRRTNLRLYLEQMVAINPKVMLIGIAPGIHGCYKTGIPFTDEHSVAKCLFFSNAGYRIASEVPEKEMSAQCIWSVLNNAAKQPLMWNIFPFHPHQQGNPNSNRNPSKQEMLLGKDILDRLCSLFEIESFYSVGTNAAQILKKDIPTIDYIRHPAYGGSTLCREQLKKIL